MTATDVLDNTEIMNQTQYCMPNVHDTFILMMYVLLLYDPFVNKACGKKERTPYAHCIGIAHILKVHISNVLLMQKINHLCSMTYKRLRETRPA